MNLDSIKFKFKGQILSELANKNECKKAVILLNMGGPSSLNEVSVFLKNMFNDPRILPIKSALIRRGVASFICNSRQNEAEQNYKAIGGKSPIVELSFELCNALNAASSEYFYTYSMRYTPPFALDVLNELKTRGVEEITLFSMYPHFSYTTLGSSLDSIKEALASLSYAPKLRIVKDYYSNSHFLKVQKNRIIQALQGAKSSEFCLLFSAHSLPQKFIEKGDPYQRQIIENAKLLENALKADGYDFCSYCVSYQSKLGPMKWLEPSTAEILSNYKDKNLLIFPISFCIDNSESDFEIRILYKQEAQKLGVREFKVAKCPNFDADFVECISELNKNAQELTNLEI